MVLTLQMLSDHIGEELDCVVTGLASFGVFVQSRKYGFDGLVELPIAFKQIGQTHECFQGFALVFKTQIALGAQTENDDRSSSSLVAWHQVGR